MPTGASRDCLSKATPKLYARFVKLRAKVNRTMASARARIGQSAIFPLLVLTAHLVGGPARSAPLRAEQVVLAPHRAVYDFTLARANAGAGFNDMTARMVYELTGSSCEGFTQNMRFVTRSTTQDGNTSVNDLRSSSWEEASGKTFRFSSNQLRDDQQQEQTAGDAARAGNEIKVELTKPQKKKTSIAPTALFPVQHSRELLAAADRDESVFQADLYDGSEKGEKVYATTAVIGPVKPAGKAKGLPAVENGEKLEALRAWPVSLSYFEPTKSQSDATPSYELAFLLFENGVVRSLTLDYGEFALKGDLKSLTFLEPSKCEAKR